MSIGLCDKGEFEWVMTSYVLQLLLLDIKKDQALYMHTWTCSSLYLQMSWHTAINRNCDDLLQIVIAHFK